MRGMEDARKTVAGVLSADLPAKAAELTTRLALPQPADDGRRVPNTIEAPRTVSANEAQTIEAWPAMLVSPLAIPRVVRTDERDGYPVLTVRYRLRLYTWVRGQGFDDVRDHADRLTLAATEILLFSTELDHAGAKTDPTTLTGSFSGIENSDTGDQIAGTYLEFDVDLDEYLTPIPASPPGPPVAEADTIIVTTLPHHPALD